MPTATKIKKEKAKKVAEKDIKAAKDKLKNNAVTKAAGDIFAKIQAKTGIDNKKVDAWQKSWLAMPEKRKKYEHLIDAPQVVGEELLGMTNDIIDFVQGEETGHSHVFKKLKEEGSAFVHHPLDYLKQKYAKGKEMAITAKTKAEEGMKKAKEMSNKAKDMAGKAQKKVKQAKKMTGKKK